LGTYDPFSSGRAAGFEALMKNGPASAAASSTRPANQSQRREVRTDSEPSRWRVRTVSSLLMALIQNGAAMPNFATMTPPRYYVINVRINGLVGPDVDPDAMPRELGVLKEYEQVVEEGAYDQTNQPHNCPPA
jgi:hypothetical protein